jgi:hypothetical protein
MTRFESLLLQISTVISALSGAIFLAMKYLLKNDDPFSVLGHPWQPYMLAAHVLVGPVVVFALGLISRDHVLGRYLNGVHKGGRRSGASTILLAAPMILSGYFLQIVTGETFRLALVIVHVATGTMFASLFFWHLRATAARRREVARNAGIAVNPPAP